MQTSMPAHTNRETTHAMVSSISFGFMSSSWGKCTWQLIEDDTTDIAIGVEGPLATAGGRIRPKV